MRVTLEGEPLPATLPVMVDTEFDEEKQMIALKLKATHWLNRHFVCTILMSTNPLTMGKILACILDFGGSVSPKEREKLERLMYIERLHPITGKYVYIRETPPWETLLEGIATISGTISK
jgi:hypothetical protein